MGNCAEQFLREDQYERLYRLLRQRTKILAKDCARARRFLECCTGWVAVGHIGASWRRSIAGGTSIYKCFARWAKVGD